MNTSDSNWIYPYSSLVVISKFNGKYILDMLSTEAVAFSVEFIAFVMLLRGGRDGAILELLFIVADVLLRGIVLFVIFMVIFMVVFIVMLVLAVLLLVIEVLAVLVIIYTTLILSIIGE